MIIRREITEYDGVYSGKRRVPEAGDSAETENKLKHVDPAVDTTYIYDAIGNLIAAQKEGLTISWTPYGKVREVHKGDSITVTYRYDATGNRVEKEVVKDDGTVTTHYERDASGNVMAIYNNTTLIEQPVTEAAGGIVQRKR